MQVRIYDAIISKMPKDESVIVLQCELVDFQLSVPAPLVIRTLFK